MGYRISGELVIDQEKGFNVTSITANELDVNPTPIIFSPADEASNVTLDSNIIITFNAAVTKGTGNITLINDNAEGTGTYSQSGTTITITENSHGLSDSDLVYIDFTSGGASDGSYTISLISANQYSVTSASSGTDSGNMARKRIYETIDVTSGNVTISAAVVTINPSSDLPAGKNIYAIVDDGCFVLANTNLTGNNVGINTYNFTTGPITVSSFSPTDGATNVDVDGNIVITFNENITKETNASTKYITIRSGNPSSGTVQQTIDVSTSAVSVSGTQATINPPSDLEYEEDTYVVVDEKSFFNSSGIDASGNALINTYNFTAAQNLNIPPLGGCDATIGGYLICCSSSNLWVIGPNSTEVLRTWYCRGDAILTANANHACNDWFIPSLSQLQNPGYAQRTHWDKNFAFGYVKYWSNTPHPASDTYACFQHLRHNYAGTGDKTDCCCVRAFRCVAY